MVAICKDGRCLRRDGKQCPEDECHRANGKYVEGWLVEMTRDPNGDDGYRLVVEVNPADAERLRRHLKNGKPGWFEYKTPFGEPRLVNTSRFDIIDFKPSGRNIANT